MFISHFCTSVYIFNCFCMAFCISNNKVVLIMYLKTFACHIHLYASNNLSILQILQHSDGIVFPSTVFCLIAVNKVPVQCGLARLPENTLLFHSKQHLWTLSLWGKNAPNEILAKKVVKMAIAKSELKFKLLYSDRCLHGHCFSYSLILSRCHYSQLFPDFVQVVLNVQLWYCVRCLLIFPINRKLAVSSFTIISGLPASFSLFARK